MTERNDSGLTGWHSDSTAIANRISEGLRSTIPAWQDVAASDLILEDLSGIGGGKTFKVSAGDRPPLILHIEPPVMCNEQDRRVRFDRVREGQALLSEEDLCARRVYEDRNANWYLEEHVGKNLTTEPVTDQFIDEVARITARLHAIPADWAIKYRERLSHRYPAMSGTEVTDHLWLHVVRFHQMLRTVSPADLELLGRLGPRPASNSGARIVTTHGDIARHNLQRRGADLLLVDLETLGANHAIADLVYTTSLLTRTNAAKDRYVRSYLEASGLPAGPEDVFELRLDIERCGMAFVWFNIDSAWSLGGLPRVMSLKHLHTVYPALVAIADEALTKETLAREIVDQGFARCARVMDVQSAYGSVRSGTPVRLHRAAPDDPSRTGLMVNWDGTIQTLASSWPDVGLVLGLDVDGSVVLTPRTETETTLRLDLSTGIPITGIGPFSTESAPLLLGGRHSAKALVRTTWRDQGGAFVGIGAPREELSVHVSQAGEIVLADGSRQTFGMYNPSRVWLSELRSPGQAPFVLNEDMSLSSRQTRHLVLGHRGHLRLVKRGDPDSLEFPALGELWRKTIRDEADAEEHVVTAPQPHMLRLESHPGKALTLDRTSAEVDDLPLTVVDEDAAEPFLIDARGLRSAIYGGQLALGVATAEPSPTDGDGR